MAKVKEMRHRRRGFTRLSSKNQATIPVDALEQAGIQPGDELRVHAEGPGRIVLEREKRSTMDFAGAASGVFPPGFLEELRKEWDTPSWTPAS
jgi:bifunctional DNA-binding transcriptional regulator/antitoxin component of YhaV-PrlF toxin-antitoxin module